MPVSNHTNITNCECVSCVVCRMSCVVCRVSCVVCRVSYVVCRVSCVVQHLPRKKDKAAEVTSFKEGGKDGAKKGTSPTPPSPSLDGGRPSSSQVPQRVKTKNAFVLNEEENSRQSGRVKLNLKDLVKKANGKNVRYMILLAGWSLERNGV
jgi:hypothetical protein